VQSLDDEMLRRIGRIHGAAEAMAAAEAAARAGFDSWNIDLMYGLPGQSREQALADLEGVIALCPPHISHYQLTIEPNTLFHSRPPLRADDDELWEMQLLCQSALDAAGYAQYEVSAYARPGSECAHNRNYWQFGDYLGIGAGAHAKITLAGEQAVRRMAKVRSPADYLSRAASADRLAENRVLSPADLGLEFMMNALRLNRGFPARLFEERTGLPIGPLASRLERAEGLGLIARGSAGVRPTPLGQRYLNDLLLLFMPDD